MPNVEKTFTATEVGTLVESFRNDLSVVAEKVGELSGKVENLDERLARVESDVTVVKDAVKVAIPAIHKRLDRLEAHAGF